MTQSEFLQLLKTTPQDLSFSDTLNFIDKQYHFSPTAFKNGEKLNAKNENMASCKILALGQLLKLSKEDTLFCFGEHYRTSVLENLDGTGHDNIRNFMSTGFEGITFTKFPLQAKHNS